jgi:peptide/nickel transport system ATP-binding protein
LPDPASPVLSVRDLVVEVATPEGKRAVVDGLSFDVAAGETLSIAGESGSGKTMTALAIMRLLPQPMARIGSGSIRLGGRDIAALPERQMRAVRGAEMAMVFQEPMTSLNPVLTIGRQLTEAIRAHERVSLTAARTIAIEALHAVRIAEPERRLKQYPHELSGGMRQRVMIAIALALRPKLLVADEPTTALDVTVQAQILRLMRSLQRDFGTALVLITHDMGIVAEMADRVLVMNDGKLVESGPVGEIFAAPRQPYTQALLAAVPRLGAMRGIPTAMTRDGRPIVPGKQPVVSVANLSVGFDIRGGVLRRPVRRVHAVEDISFDVMAGETLAIVGESGCGKSTTGKALLSLVPWDGAIAINGQATRGLARGAMKPVRRVIQMIFQDPYASLDPRMTVGDLVAEPMVVHGIARGGELRERVAELFRRVELSPDQMQRHPHEFSGGQRQRICIARALSLSPKIIVADESVSALDVSVQARVLDLLQELQADLGISYLFISHDMAVVERIGHRVAVMYLGQIVEMGTRAQLFADPPHAYTQRRLAAVPSPAPARRRATPVAEGDVPTAIHAIGAGPAKVELRDIGDGHLVAV